MKKRIGLFICVGAPDVEARKKELETVFPAELYIHAVSRELFGFELNVENMKFLDKMITRAMKGDKNNVSEINEENIVKLAKAMSQS